MSGLSVTTLIGNLNLKELLAFNKSTKLIWNGIYQAQKLIKTDDLILFCFLFVSDINIKESSKQRAPAFTFGNRWDMSKKTQRKKVSRCTMSKKIWKLQAYRYFVSLMFYQFITYFALLVFWSKLPSLCCMIFISVCSIYLYFILCLYFSISIIYFLEIDGTHWNENHAT